MIATMAAAVTADDLRGAAADKESGKVRTYISRSFRVRKRLSREL